MAAIGGSISNVSIGGRNYPVPADNSPSVKLGGYENEVNANGDFTARVLKTAVPWSITGLMVSCDNAQQDDHDYLKSIADSLSTVPFTISYADGVSYGGSGTITSEVTYDPSAATISLEVSGSGSLTRVS